MGCSPWGREEPDTTERLHFHFSLSCIGGGNGNPLQYSSLGKSHGQRSLAGYSAWDHQELDTLAWKIPWTEEPSGLQTIGLLRVGHD